MSSVNGPDLKALKDAFDIAAWVRRKGVELEKAGKHFVGRCPLPGHEDENGSFTITGHLWNCFGCNRGGSIIDLLMEWEGLTQRQAIDWLLEQTGGSLRRASSLEPEPKEAPTQLVEEARAQRLLERVVEIYEKTLNDVPEGRAYLESRGIEDPGLWSQHRIGYSNGRLRETLPKEGKVINELKSLGVLLKNGRERFTGCVVVPVFDVEGNIVTLYGRQAGPASRGASKGHYYLPNRPTGLWNIGTIKHHAHLFLVESVFDGLSVIMAGHPNCVAIQGTHGLSDPALFAEHSVNRITLLLDGDESGKKASEQLKATLLQYTVDVVMLPDGRDPNDHLCAEGASSLAELLVQPELPAAATQEGPAVPAPQATAATQLPQLQGFVVNVGIRSYEVRSIDKSPSKLKVTVRREHAGKLHVDTVDLYNARQRRQLTQDLARVFEEPAEAVEADITKLITTTEGMQQQDAAGHLGERPQALPEMSPEERREAEAFAKAPDLIEQIGRDYERCGLIGEEANRLLAYLVMTSRKMPDPLSLLVLSSSGAGKTALQDTTVAFAPPEELVKVTSLSGKALFYKERTSLKHKVLALEEGDGAEEASYAIRNLISAKELVMEATIKDLQTGKLTTMENKVEGPTAVFITTTDPNTDPETKSRFIVTSIDESREQTRRILEYQRRRHTREGLADQADVEGIRRRHHNFQRLLKPISVINPFANQLGYGDDRLQGRRDQPKYLNLIAAVAFLRQAMKPIRHHGVNGDRRAYVEVDKEDIRIGNELAVAILGRSLDELSRPGRDLLEELEQMHPGSGETAKRQGPHASGFTRREVRERTGWNNTRVHRYLRELVELEYVIVENGRNGTALQRYRLLYNGEGKSGEKFVLG
ncbi:MAG: CHC2 zinc finger domain-containing protein, partial [Boseongicola sp.]|nr:CHC2 zinc finger domain-containing protein [Boseongicola sp.]